MSKALADDEIIYEEFTWVNNEAEKYCKMKKSTRKKNRQRDHIEKHKLIRIGIYEIVKSNKMVNNNLICQL